MHTEHLHNIWKCIILYSIMMLMNFSDLSQSDRSNSVMLQVKDPCPRLGWNGCLTRENGFHKKYKNLDNIAEYLIASLKSKWKNKQIKMMNNWIWYLFFFIYVLEHGNLQWNSWIFKMIDYLKGSILKFKLNFEKALENKCESVWLWQVSSKTLVCLGWGN